MSWIKATDEILLEPGKVKALQTKVKELEDRLHEVERQQRITVYNDSGQVVEKVAHTRVLYAILNYLKLRMVIEPAVPATPSHVSLEKKK